MTTPSTIDLLTARLVANEPPTLTEQTDLREELRTRLQRGTWVVEFTKVDGTPSVMECTLDQRLIPSDAAPSQSGDATPNQSILRVYALDREGWRSFKVLNVKRFYQKPDNL